MLLGFPPRQNAQTAGVDNGYRYAGLWEAVQPRATSAACRNER
jgi:hypothetical protein